MSRQAPASWSEADTLGYKEHDKDAELTVKQKQNIKVECTEDSTFHILTQPDRHEPTARPGRAVISYSFATSSFKSNITVSERSAYQQTPAYYAVCSQFGPSKPDVTLHAGGDQNGSRVAVAYFRFSRHIRMGFGVETVNGEGRWEEMKNTSNRLGHGNYEFDYDVPGGVVEYVHDIDENAGRTRKKFVWERTRDESDGVKSVVERHVGWRNYKLVEQDSGRVLAVMLASMFTSVSYKGELNLLERLTDEMEKVVIMSAVCILEKGERRIGRYSFGRAPS